MRILVLGGCGAQGSFICRELVKHSKVSEVISADLNIEKAKRFVSKYHNPKLSAMKVDLSKVDEVEAVVKGSDVVINAASYIFNLRIMKACAKAGASYQDLAFGASIETRGLDMLGAFKKELELDQDYKDQGTIALVNTGMDPGISDLMAGYAADNLDHLYEARLKDVAILKSKTPVSTWSPSLLWADMISDAAVYENGEYKRVPPFSHEETYVFPDPMGPQPCYMHSHEEVCTFPLFLKDLRYVEFKMGGPDMPFAKAVWDYGLAKDKPIKVKGKEVVPLDVFLALTPPALTPDEIEMNIEDGTLIDEIACLTLDCKGEKKGKDIESTYYTILSLKEVNKRIFGVTATSYYVGMGVVALTELLIENRIATTGVAPPEAYTTQERQEAIQRLAEKGINIHKIEHTQI